MSIRCVFLKPAGITVRCVIKNADWSAEARVPLYHEAEGATLYHLGVSAMTDLDGRVWSPAPIGAMWHCDWLVGLQLFSGAQRFDRNPDGLVLSVRTPGGDWNIDGQSWDPDRKLHGAGWTRTGVAPCLTVTPSIDIRGKYHGWLRDGYLEPV